MIYDPKAKRTSVTATFAYGFFILTVISLIRLHIETSENSLTPTVTTALCWLLATVLYMFRSLEKAKIDLDDKSIELDSSDEADKTPQRSE